MQILLRSWIEKGVRQAVSEDPVLGRLADADSFITMDAESPEFETYLRICNSVGKRILFWPRMLIGKSELAEVELFELDSSGRGLRESDRICNYTQAYLQSLPLRETGGGAFIWIMAKAFKNKIEFPPNCIRALSDWANEYVIPAGVQRDFKDAGLAGFAGNPMFTLDGKEIPDYFLLYINSILPPVVRDKTVLISGLIPQKRHYSRLGYLCYDLDSIGDHVDFYRTAEPFCAWSLTSIIASKSVKSCVEANKLKGWRFRPVLNKHTPLYQTYLSLWEGVFTLLEKHAIVPLWYA